VAWATASDETGGNWKLTVDTSLDSTLIVEEDFKNYSLLVIGTLVDFPSDVTRSFPIAVTITETSCECDYLLWDNPASIEALTVLVDIPLVAKAIPAPLPDSTTNHDAAHPSFRKCYLESGTCETDGSVALIGDITIDGAPLTDGWITFDAAAQTLSFTPTKEHISSYVVGITWSPEHGLAHTYTAFTVVVQCEVVSFTAPTSNPDDITYTIFDDMVFFYMTDHVYT